MGPCETYRFSEQYNLTVDDEPWQYWMKKETPSLAPLSQPAKRAVVPLLRAPTGNVTYATLDRRWRDGDRLSLSLPMELRATYYVGKNQVAGTQRWAYEYGPTLLAARPTAEGAWDTKKDCLVIKGVKPA